MSDDKKPSAFSGPHYKKCERPGCDHARINHAQIKDQNVSKCLLCDCKGFTPETATPNGTLWNTGGNGPPQ